MTQYYGGHATDVVGFAWDGDTYCPRCTLERMGVATTGPVIPGPVMESEIDIWVIANGLEMHREDSQRVPQPIFNGEDAMDMDLGRACRCGRCHEPLIETDEEPEEEA
jgi:hypothetical protein